MDKTKNTGVTTSNQAKLRSKFSSSFPRVSARFSATVCVRGKNSCDIIWIVCGSTVTGKNVPLMRNIGVIKRKEG